MDGTGAGTDDAPAALGLDLAEPGADPGQGIGHAACVGHLIEAVRCRHRPDLYRLEQDVVARVAPVLGGVSRAGQGGSIPGHGWSFSISAVYSLLRVGQKGKAIQRGATLPVCGL